MAIIGGGLRLVFCEGYWDVEPEGGAFTELTFEADGACEHSGQLSANGEAEARSIGAASYGAICLLEFFKYFFLVGVRDAAAGIGYRQAQRFFVQHSSFNINSAIFRSEFYRIAEEVGQNLFDLAGIGGQFGDVFIDG